MLVEAKKFVIHLGIESSYTGLPPSSINLNPIIENVPEEVLIQIADLCLTNWSGFNSETPKNHKFMPTCILLCHILANLSGMDYDENIVTPKKKFLVDLCSIKVFPKEQLALPSKNTLVLFDLSGIYDSKPFERYQSSASIVKIKSLQELTEKQPKISKSIDPKALMNSLFLLLELESIGSLKKRKVYSLTLYPLNS